MAQVVGKDHHTNKINCSCVDLEDWFLGMLWRKTKFKYDADVWIEAEVGFGWVEVLPVGISATIGAVSCSGARGGPREESEGFLNSPSYRHQTMWAVLSDGEEVEGIRKWSLSNNSSCLRAIR